jgi:hypothetical protein
MVSKVTKKFAPLSEFVNVDRVLQDAQTIADSGRGRRLTVVQTALSLLRNYTPSRTPEGFRLIDLLRKFDKQTDGQLGGKLGACPDGDRKQDEWLLMFVAGMWFQDLWTYDFRRTEMCIIPYATQMGEISFCAYNTGVGWRQIVENMYQNATVAVEYPAESFTPCARIPQRRCPCHLRHDHRSRCAVGTALSSSGCQAPKRKSAHVVDHEKCGINVFRDRAMAHGKRFLTDTAM